MTHPLAGRGSPSARAPGRMRQLRLVGQLVDVVQEREQLRALGFAGAVERLGRGVQKLVGESARSSMPLPRMGSELAVEVTMMSNCARRSGSSERAIASAEKRAASCAPRSRVRLATVMDFGVLAAKCVAARSIMSPAPIKSTRCLAIAGKMRSANRTAAAAMEIEALPISVLVRTSLATANVR